MKKIMLVGRIASGKTTLCQYLNNETLEYHKTQTIQVIGDNMIDTPGEYLERRNYYRALIVTSVEAEVIVLVQDATDETNMFAPQFSTMFAKPVVGVVTKCDLAQPDEIERAKEFLRSAGADPIFVTSSITGEGCEELYTYLSI
ncbi:EutP/PduV family microcompartment system protein [Hydrogenoanaerobacterium sp.]|uniref:EutP/PduV family microcompartment system protein n=1 Tax=Hydrogenoanaerobacterium sp. TaxID=2953763 RepID=UPI00289E798D|nr:EutP/PduV family microcompartment system protein [Hydrogenoanaerobacterium sp.]